MLGTNYLKAHNARITFGIQYPSEMSLQLYLALLHLEGSLNIIDFVKDVGEFSLPWKAMNFS